MVPLVHDPGVEAEVDWGESMVHLRGLPTKVYIFHMCACHSGGAFAMAFPRETQQAFLRHTCSPSGGSAECSSSSATTT
jgi:hypothetical protein